MARDRRWLWLAGALTAVLGALAWGVPLATLLAVAALLACPAAMFFGMGMMGRTQEGGMACHPGAQRAHEEAQQVSLAGPSGSEAVTAPQRHTGSAAAMTDADADPMLILKRRLAAGEMTPEEYERLARIIAGAPAGTQSAAAATERAVTHGAG